MNCILTVKLTEETYIIHCKEITLFAHDSWHHDSIFSCPFEKTPLCQILFTVYLWTTWKLQERCELQLVAWYSFRVSRPNLFDYSSIRLNWLLLMSYQRQHICNPHPPPPHPPPTPSPPWTYFSFLCKVAYVKILTFGCRNYFMKTPYLGFFKRIHCRKLVYLIPSRWSR